MISPSRKRSNSKYKEIISLSWVQYGNYLDYLCKKIKRSRIKFDYVFGIPRGGLIPATIISHTLGIKLTTSFLCVLNIKDNKKILLVDDVVDKNVTMKEYLNNANSFHFKMVKTATIFKHEKSDYTPDFYVATNKNWIKFPYEKD